MNHDLKFSPEIETRIQSFLDDIRTALKNSSHPLDQQLAILEQLDTQIRSELAASGSGFVTMEKLEIILSRMDPPSAYGPFDSKHPREAMGSVSSPYPQSKLQILSAFCFSLAVSSILYALSPYDSESSVYKVYSLYFSVATIFVLYGFNDWMTNQFKVTRLTKVLYYLIILEVWGYLIEILHIDDHSISEILTAICSIVLGVRIMKQKEVLKEFAVILGVLFLIAGILSFPEMPKLMYVVVIIYNILLGFIFLKAATDGKYFQASLTRTEPPAPLSTPTPVPVAGVPEKPNVNLQNTTTQTHFVSERKILPAVLLNFFLGWCGAHRFYAGKIGTAFIQLFTFGGLGIWTFIDFILLVCGVFTDKDGRRMSQWT